MTDAIGALRGGEHVLPVRICYEDTDAGGIVYYANYLRYSERARSDLLRIAGIEQRKLAAERSLFFAVRRCEVDYLRPVHLDDEVEVCTRLVAMGGATLDVLHRFVVAGTERARMAVRVACVHSNDGRPARIPDDLRNSLRGLIT